MTKKKQDQMHHSIVSTHTALMRWLERDFDAYNFSFEESIKIVSSIIGATLECTIFRYSKDDTSTEDKRDAFELALDLVKEVNRVKCEQQEEKEKMNEEQIKIQAQAEKDANLIELQEEVIQRALDHLEAVKSTIKETVPYFAEEEGESYLNFTMDYSLAIKVVENLFKNITEQQQKENVRELLESDICDFVDGELVINQESVKEVLLGLKDALEKLT